MSVPFCVSWQSKVEKKWWQDDISVLLLDLKSKQILAMNHQKSQHFKGRGGVWLYFFTGSYYREIHTYKWIQNINKYAYILNAFVLSFSTVTS